MTAAHRTKVRTGVVGVGNMGAHHARVYGELPDADLVGVADADPDRARSVADHHGCETLPVDDLLDRVDAVTVAVPTAHHASLARKCIRRGVDVLVEKPFVETPEEGRELIALAEAHDVTVQVGHVERFNPAVRAALEFLPAQKLIAVDARRLGPPRDPPVPDSVVTDLMIHDIDVVLAMVDADVERINAVSAKDDRYVDAQLTFGDGTAASLTASRVTQEKVRKLTITTEDCWVTVDYLDQSIEIHRHSEPAFTDDDGDLRYRHEGIVERPMVESGEALKNELAAFVDYSVSGATPRVTAADGVRALELARRIDRLAADPASRPIRADGD